MREVVKGNLRYRTKIEREDEIGFLARSFNDMVGGLEERERIRDTFGRFVSHDVAEAVLSGRVPLEGERRDVSILFQDIRGFTSLSERLDPAALLALLNQFFTEVVAAVEAEGGVVKQFLGDGVMALFGAPQAYPDHAERAVRAALGIVRRLRDLNERSARRSTAPTRDRRRHPQRRRRGRTDRPGQSHGVRRRRRRGESRQSRRSADQGNARDDPGQPRDRAQARRRRSCFGRRRNAAGQGQDASRSKSSRCSGAAVSSG